MSSSIYQGVVQNDQRIHTESYDSSIGSCRRNYPPHKPWYTEYRNTTTRWYSPHGRVGAGTQAEVAERLVGFAPRACGGWERYCHRYPLAWIRPTGVWGLGACSRNRTLAGHSPHGRVGAGRRGMMPVGTRLFIPRACGGWGASRCYTAYRSIYPRTRGAMIRSCNVRKHRR